MLRRIMAKDGNVFQALKCASNVSPPLWISLSFHSFIKWPEPPSQISRPDRELPDIYSLKVTSRNSPFLLNIPSTQISVSAAVFFLSPQNNLNLEHMFLVLP